MVLPCSVLNAFLGAAVYFAVTATLSAQAPGGTQPLSQTPYATHDWTRDGTGVSRNEGWADVKTPGDGRTYTVGTISVGRIDPNNSAPFSNAAVGLPPVPVNQGGFVIPGTATVGQKQVVLLQCAGRNGGTGANADQQILWQRYWYGDSNLGSPGPDGRKATNARGISVWPVLFEDGTVNERDTRVAICGETYDSILPQNQFDGLSGWTKNDGSGNPPTVPLTGLAAYSRGLASGYVAVYDGAGNLQWSHQFFFQDPGLLANEGACAITDLSIRVEDGPNGPRDVVTYCGISAFGVPSTAMTESLAPRLPFVAAPASPWVSSSGDMDHGHGQWDGIVGRLSNDHGSQIGSQVMHDFHSVVGGVGQDGLFGLHEVTPDRFVVVGSTSEVTLAPAASNRFPFQVGIGMPNQGYCVGTVSVFDAAPTRTGGNLVLDTSFPVGGLDGTFTHLADVTAHADAMGAGPFLGRIAVVGSTDDANVLVNLGVLPAVAKGPAVDGFLMTMLDLPGTPSGAPIGGSFQGSASGQLCGIASWSEHTDRYLVCGTEPEASATDTAAYAFFIDTPNGLEQMLSHRGGRTAVNGSSQSPVAIGFFNVMNNSGGGGSPSPNGYQFNLGMLGSPAGGGIAVDERGRVDVVGKTNAAALRIGSFSRGYTGAEDAIRLVLNMLPDNVGRSDMTGQLVHNGVAIPAPVPGTTGGTTPAMDLLPLGPQVGMPATGVTLPRIHIDWEGPAPSQTPGTTPIHSILINRPTQSQVSIVVPAAIVGVPIAPGPVPLIEDWITSSPFVLLTPFVTNGQLQSARIPLLLPAGPATFTVQAFCLFPTPLSGSSSTLTASPAITFSY